MIFESLSSLDELKSVRLLSKYDSELTSPRLFYRVKVTTRRENFDRLTALSRSKVARHVRRIHHNLFAMSPVHRAEWDTLFNSRQRTTTEKGRMAESNTYEYRNYYDGQS